MQHLYDYIFGSKKLHRPNFDTTIEEFCDCNNIDINNINENQLVVFYEYKQEYCHTADARNKYLENIVESLTSYSGKKLAVRLQKIVGNHGDVSFYEKEIPHTIIIYLHDEYLLNDNSFMDFTLSDTKESDKIYWEIENFNYHIAEISKVENNNIIVIEPRYSEDVTKKLRNKTDIFYHVTLNTNIDKIFKRGITPKVGKTRIQGGYRYFPEKVFLIADSNDIVKDIKEIIRSKKYQNNLYSIIKIDLSGHDVGLYVDNYYDSDNIVYTFEAIPPSLLSVVDINDL